MTLQTGMGAAPCSPAPRGAHGQEGAAHPGTETTVKPEQGEWPAADARLGPV